MLSIWGFGKRVKKKVYDSNGYEVERVIFVYSGGKLVEEYSTQPPPTEPTTKYVATDTLQSVRAITNQDGEVISRRDFLPFGAELPNSSQPGFTGSLRTTAFKYGNDDVRQKFTGYQKDEETGLDFAEARMYNNRHARFTAVDPLLASGKSGNPQTFNRYVYVMNRPLSFRDPTGLQAAGTITPTCPPECSGDSVGNVVGGRVVYNINTEPIAVVETNERITYLTSITTIIDSPDALLSTSLVNEPLQEFDATLNTATVTGATATALKPSIRSLNLRTTVTRVTVNGRPPPTSSTIGPTVLRTAVLGVGAAAIILALPATVQAPSPNDDKENRLMNRVFRVFGGGSPQAGFSWTPVDPRTVPDYRGQAGLPNVNTGEWLVTGLVDPRDIIMTKVADELDGNRGGLAEWIINPASVRQQEVTPLIPNL